MRIVLGSSLDATRTVVVMVTALLIVGGSSAGAAADTPPAATEESGDPAMPEQTVEGNRPWDYNNKTRYAHTSPEVNGSTITVTKKTSVVDLDAQPVVIDNNQRELFDRLPSIVLAEQQNPTELNLSYRGLGNPQESE
jgi:Fe(3+) dicitrate transport protein